jgi:deoxyribonuclease-4
VPWFGAHLSIAGGLSRAITEARRLGMDTVQLFTHSPSQWGVKAAEPVRRGTGKSQGSEWVGAPLTREQVRKFQKAIADSALRFPTAHDSYLINLAAADEMLWRKSIAGFAWELRRAEQLGLSYLVMHPGSHVGQGEEAGLKRVAEGLNEVLAQVPAGQVMILLETTAGQGSSLGYRFEHLAELLSRVNDPERLGVCFDTCHVFAAGYGLSTPEEYAATLEEFDQRIGLEHLKLFHLNDSAKGRGSRVDRHAGIGLGKIGETAFRCLVNDPRFAALPMILETPKKAADGTEMDPINLRKLREYLGAGPSE